MSEKTAEKKGGIVADWLREKSGFNAAKAAPDRRAKEIEKAAGGTTLREESTKQSEAADPYDSDSKMVDKKSGIRFANGGPVKSKKPQYR